MARTASTTARGYDYQHRKGRADALKAFRDGDPCCRCYQPMWHGQPLEYDHEDDRSGYRGLAHAHCNRSAGARKGNAMRAQQAPRRCTRDW